jgi:hypothetical protein
MSTKPAQTVSQSWNPFRDADQWWFGRGSPVALGLFRIIMSLVAFVSLVLTLFDFDAWYTNHGYMPASVAQNWSRMPETFEFGPYLVHMPNARINFLTYFGNDTLTLVVYILVLVAALLTAVGLWTRFNSIFLAVGMICIHHRNALILHSGDTLMRIALMYLALAPSGAACSLDRLIKVWKGRAPLQPPDVSLWAQRLIQYQTALVYFTTVWWKWFGTFWKDGTATWYPENLNEFYRFPVPNFLHHQPFIALATYGTLVVELSMATLVFYRPLRKYVLLGGIAMHGYIEYRMNIPFFAFTIVATYICFYDGEEISAWAKKVGERLRRFRILVELPKGYQLQPAALAALQTADPFSLVSYDPGMNGDWTAMDLTGRTKSPFRGSLFRSLGAWPYALVPGLWRRKLMNSLVPAEGTIVKAGSPMSKKVRGAPIKQSLPDGIIDAEWRDEDIESPSKES